MARTNITAKELCRRMNDRGIKIAESTLCGKLKGKYPFNFDEAECIRKVLEVEIPLEVLFEREA